MEVHAHTHPSTGSGTKKKWTHYFWEFFMLFLAVTLGFFVENQREHMVEHQREKKYIRSMVADLKTDTAYFAATIRMNKSACDSLDALIFLLSAKTRALNGQRIYTLARFTPFNDLSLFCQDKTYEQMKNSGSLRLIRKEEILGEISEYYQINKYIESGPTPMQFQNRRDFIQSMDRLFDAATLQEMMRAYSEKAPLTAGKKYTLLSDDPAVINQVCTRFHFMYSTKKIINRDAENFAIKATRLLKRLKEEYHLNEKSH